MLATITPADYSAMRGKLASSSGFQSSQYRAMEFMMGNKQAAMIDVHRAAPDEQNILRDQLVRPSLYDESLRFLARNGFPVPEDRLNRDFTQP